MKRLAILGSLVLLLSGCATWGGIKQDSSEAWSGTKQVIHNATED